ncbi:MAG: tetratricopeptide repeat protein [Planctomycetaceae bacterium]
MHDDSSADVPSIALGNAHPDVAGAITEARNAVVREPESAEAWGHLAMVLMAHDFGPRANECFAEAERLDAQDFRWPYLRGVNLSVTDTQAALACYRRAVALRDDVAFARLRLAEMLIDLGRPEEARVQLLAVLEREPDNPRAALGLARLAYGQGDYAEARRWAEKSAAAAPGQRTTHELLAQIHHRLGDQNAAQAQLAVLKHIPEGETTWEDPLVTEVLGMRQGPNVMVLRAQELMQRGQPQSAVAILEPLAAEQPHDPEHHYELAHALLLVGRNERAAGVLDRAIEWHPESSEMRRLRGIVHFSQDEWQPAAERFRQAIRLKPDDAVSHYNLGHCLLRLGEKDAALAAFHDAARFQPDFADAHTNIGRLLLEAGHPDEAAKHLRLATQFAPEDPEPQRLLKKAIGGER